MNPYFEAGMQFRMALANVWNSNWVYTRRLLIVVLAIGFAPKIERYWLGQMPAVPPVSASVVVFAGFASIFMLAAAALVYVCGLLLLQIGRNERVIYSPSAPPSSAPSLSQKVPSGDPSGGSFTVADDETLWLQEQFDDLKKKGVLTETDGLSLEERAKELGLSMIMKAAGRTE